MSEASGIGAAVRRKEDRRFLTGRGNYVARHQAAGQVVRACSCVRRMRMR